MSLRPILTTTLPALLLALAFGLERTDTSGGKEKSSERIVKLKVYPDTGLKFDRPFSAAQLLISAVLENGEVVDVTREAKMQSIGGLVEMDQRGQIRPVADGTGSLKLKIRESILEIPVSVEGMNNPFRPEFVRDIQPILTRVGCNAGTCHGSANGKNGFQLSLRGYDPDFDHASLTDDLAGRRFNPAMPEQSLFLLKPTASVPHEGGQLLKTDSDFYAMLRLWVERGAPYESQPTRPTKIRVVPENPILKDAGASQQFAVWATYPDGSEKDVTREAFLEINNTEVLSIDSYGLVTAIRRGEAAVLARFEGAYDAAEVTVMGQRDGFVWSHPPAHNRIDELVYEKLRRVKILPSEICSDAEFLRRVSLDLTGRLPTVQEVRSFLMDRRDTRLKREEMIDRLLGSAAFVEYWTSKWSDLLQVNSKFLGKEGAERFRDWIQASVASNQPYDEFVREMLAAEGSTYENPPTAYYKILREPDLVMENTTQLFLGVRFNCNKCHDHPFERWTRDNHWELASYFGRVKRTDVKGSPKMPRIGVDAPPAYEESIQDNEEGEIHDPDTGEVLVPRFPYEHPGSIPAKAPRRQQFVHWLTAAENPYFAQSYVNRLWSYFFGIGIMEPVDDLRANNPPSNPQLLDFLTSSFIESEFNVRALMRSICRSRIYQAAVTTNEWNEDDPINFSHAQARRLPAEVLHSAVYDAAGAKERWVGGRSGVAATELLDPSLKAGDGFLDLFGRPARESACECERGTGLSLGQALNLVNGPTIADALHDPHNDLHDLAAAEKDAGRIIEELYLRFLGRLPTADERRLLIPSFDPYLPENRAALKPEEEASLWQEFLTWQNSMQTADWTPLQILHASSKEQATLTAQEDGSILVGGKLPEKDTYSFVTKSPLAKITAIRLEVLSHPDLPAKGPGRAENGNFVLNELRASAVPIAHPANSKPLVLQNATGDFSQANYPLTAIIDGKAETGWAVSPQFGKKHEVYLELQADFVPSDEVLLFLTLEQNYGAKHVLGRIRISATAAERPVRHHGLPEDLAATLKIPPEQRTEEQVAALYGRFMKDKPQYVDKIRQGATFDVAWALVNSSAFLFNR